MSRCFGDHSAQSHGISRRGFLKQSAVVGGTSAGDACRGKMPDAGVRVQSRVPEA